MKQFLFVVLMAVFCTVHAEPTIKVTAPNGGEKLTRGTQVFIVWEKSKEVTENVKIDLYQNGTLVTNITPSAPGVSYAWKVPFNFVGNNFKIIVTSTLGAFLNDESDAVFEILGGSTKVTVPNGGEVFTRGTQVFILWEDDLTEKVKIELWENDIFKQVIADSVAGNSFAWQIPLGLAGSNFKIRVGSQFVSSITDLSDKSFSVPAGSLSLLSPSANDTLGLCMENEIRWNNTIPNDPLKLELIKDSKVVRNFANISSSGRYEFYPDLDIASGSGYQVRISSIALSSQQVTSSKFIIQGTILKGGNINQVFTKKYSPYILTEKTTIPVGSTLELQGAKLVVMDSLKINGLLNSDVKYNQIFVNAPIVGNGGIALQNSEIMQGSSTWQRRFSSNGIYGKAYSVKSAHMTPDGGSILILKLSGVDARIIKLDARGDQQWEKTFTNSGINKGDILDIKSTSDGGFIIAGLVLNSITSEDAWITKLDNTGNQQWEKFFTSDGAYNDRASSVYQTSDGGYVWAGTIYIGNLETYKAWVVKIDINGDKQWEKKFTSKGVASCVIQTSDGGYIFGGSDYIHSENFMDALIVKLDDKGDQQWEKTYGHYNRYQDIATTIQQTLDGGYIVAGNMYSNTTQLDGWVAKLEANGEKVWEKFFDGNKNDNDGVKSIQQTLDGGYIVAGWKGDGSNYPDIWFSKLYITGGIEWERLVDISETKTSIATSIQQTSDNGYMLAGHMYMDSERVDAFVAKLDANGNGLKNSGLTLTNSTNSSFKNCLFTNFNNSALTLNNSSPEIYNSTFSNNRGTNGGAIYATGNSTPKITNSIFWGNSATTGKSICLDGTTAKPEFRNNLIEGGYKEIGLLNGAILGNVFKDNISSNPLFADTISYKLQEKSPCVNAGLADISQLGLPSTDLWGNNRVMENKIDIGCYEYNPSSSLNDMLEYDFTLNQNYPNPFNPETTINYTLRDGYQGLVKLSIYNIKGEFVKTLVNGIQTAGSHTATFNGSSLSSGLYYYLLHAGDFKVTKKMMMIK